MDSSKEFEVVITVTARRTHPIATGKEVVEKKDHVISDLYTPQELTDLIANIIPIAEPI